MAFHVTFVSVGLLLFTLFFPAKVVSIIYPEVHDGAGTFVLETGLWPG